MKKKNVLNLTKIKRKTENIKSIQNINQHFNSVYQWY